MDTNIAVEVTGNMRTPDNEGRAWTSNGVFTGTGWGKVILLGEHGVIRGQAALAASLDRGVRAAVKAGVGKIEVPAWSLNCKMNDGTRLGQAMGLVMRRLAVDGAVDVYLDADIPGGAGLGGSAALATAVANAVAAMTGASQELVTAAVADSERFFHGQASGVDAAAARSRGIGIFRSADGWVQVPVVAPLQVCVGLTGRPHETSAEVARVKEICDRFVVAGEVLTLMGRLAEEGASAVLENDGRRLGGLMNIAHGLLSAIGVSCRPLEELVHLAREQGAWGAKLSGAGGGGCVIALPSGEEDRIIPAWRQAGYRAFPAVLGRA